MRYNLHFRPLQNVEAEIEARAEIHPVWLPMFPFPAPVIPILGFPSNISLINHLHRNPLLKVSFRRPQVSTQTKYFHFMTLQMILSLLEHTYPSSCPLGNLSFKYHVTLPHCQTIPDHLIIK